MDLNGRDRLQMCINPRPTKECIQSVCCSSLSVGSCSRTFARAQRATLQRMPLPLRQRRNRQTRDARLWRSVRHRRRRPPQRPSCGRRSWRETGQDFVDRRLWARAKIRTHLRSLFLIGHPGCASVLRAGSFGCPGGAGGWVEHLSVLYAGAAGQRLAPRCVEARPQLYGG